MMARGDEPSRLLSLDDDPTQPSQRLYSLAADIARLAPRIKHRRLTARSSVGRRWFEIFPGEHYNLLTASRCCSPRASFGSLARTPG